MPTTASELPDIRKCGHSWHGHTMCCSIPADISPTPTEDALSFQETLVIPSEDKLLGKKRKYYLEDTFSFQETLVIPSENKILGKNENII